MTEDEEPLIPMYRHGCEQCGDITGELQRIGDYGLLCPRCALRQVEHDDQADGTWRG